jgi:hypothetical protein
LQRRAGRRHDCAGRDPYGGAALDDDPDTRARARDRVETGKHHRANGRPDGGIAIDRTGPNDSADGDPDSDSRADADSDNGSYGDRHGGPDGDDDNGSDRRADTEPGRGYDGASTGTNGASDPLADSETDGDADAALTFADPNSVTNANGLTEADAFTVTEAELAAADREDRKPERQGGSVFRDRRLGDRSRRRQDRAQLRRRG